MVQMPHQAGKFRDTMTAISINRAKGSLLPSKNQANSDLIPMEPIRQVIETIPNSDLVPNNYRARMQSQNQ